MGRGGRPRRTRQQRQEVEVEVEDPQQLVWTLRSDVEGRHPDCGQEDRQVCELLLCAFLSLGAGSLEPEVQQWMCYLVYGGPALWAQLRRLLKKVDEEGPPDAWLHPGRGEEAEMNIIMGRAQELRESLARAESLREEGKQHVSRKAWAAACQVYAAARKEDALKARHPRDLERTWAPSRSGLLSTLLVNEAICRYHLGELDRGIELCKEASIANRNNFKCQFWHAKLLSAKGQRGPALALARQLRSPREYRKWDAPNHEAGRQLYAEIKAVPTGRGPLPFRRGTPAEALECSIRPVYTEEISDAEDESRDVGAAKYFERNLEEARVSVPAGLSAGDVQGSSVRRLTIDSGDSSLYAFGGIAEHFPAVESFTYSCEDCLRVAYDFRGLAHWSQLRTLRLHLSGQAQIAEGDHGLEVLAPLVNLESFHVCYVRYGLPKDIKVVECFKKLRDLAWWGTEIRTCYREDGGGKLLEDGGGLLDLSGLAQLRTVFFRGLSFCSERQTRLNRASHDHDGALALRPARGAAFVLADCELTNKLRLELGRLVDLAEFESARRDAGGKGARRAGGGASRSPVELGAPAYFVPDAAGELRLRTEAEMAASQTAKVQKTRGYLDETLAYHRAEQRRLEGSRRPASRLRARR